MNHNTQHGESGSAATSDPNPSQGTAPEGSGQREKERNLTVQPDVAETRRAVNIIVGSFGVVELRVPKAGQLGTISGYFDNPEALAKAAVEADGNGPGVYVTLNPVNPALSPARRI